MTLAKWNPLRELQAMERDMSRLFSRMGGDPFDAMRFEGGEQDGRRHWTLATDVIATVS